jgi:Protein of unknown function (DUF3592)
MSLIAAAVALIGTIAIAVAGRRSMKRAAQWFEGKPVVNGRLTRCVEQDDGDLWSTIEYDVRGQRYQITGNYEHTREDVGRTLPVAYDPSLPSTARLVEKDERVLATGDVVFFGIVFVAIYLLVMAVLTFAERL